MARRIPKTSGKEFKRRSRAAKKGWKTRRIKSKVLTREERLKKAIEATNTAIKGRDAAKLALHMALNQKFGDSRLRKKILAAFRENLAHAERTYQAFQAEERKLAWKDRREQKALAKRDPEAFGIGMRERIRKQIKEDRKGIPELIERLYTEVLDYDMGEHYDESDIWDIYKES